MFKIILKRLLSNAGWEFRRIPPLPYGIDHTADLERFSPDKEISTIFDVGANRGETVHKYHQKFPRARIFAFEPISETYHHLQSRTDRLKNITCYRCAFGAQVGEVEVFLHEDDHLHSINPEVNTPDRSTRGSEVVPVNTIDAFLRDHDEEVSTIDLLKIDTEGWECEVLDGARQALSNQRIRFVIAEVTFRDPPLPHTNFVAVQALLSKYGFVFLGIYEPEYWGNPTYCMGYCNALFKYVSKETGDSEI